MNFGDDGKVLGHFGASWEFVGVVAASGSWGSRNKIFLREIETGEQSSGHGWTRERWIVEATRWQRSNGHFADILQPFSYLIVQLPHQNIWVNDLIEFMTRIDDISGRWEASELDCSSLKTLKLLPNGTSASTISGASFWRCGAELLLTHHSQPPRQAAVQPDPWQRSCHREPR